MQPFLPSLKLAVFVTVLAWLLRKVAIAYAWELPSQIGTMVLFAPLLACVASVAWQPYSVRKRLRVSLAYVWCLSITIACCFFVLWNWVFHDGVFNRHAILSNAYHWIVFFCVAWLGLRALSAVSSSWFKDRFKPDPLRLIDLFIAMSLAAIVMACFCRVPTVGIWTNYPAVPQFVHAVWGAAFLTILWGVLAWTIGIRRHRIWVIFGIIIATAAARTMSPYMTSQLEGYWTDKKIVLVSADAPAFQQRSGTIPLMPEPIGNGRIWTEARVVNVPRSGERLIEAMIQVASILIVISLITAKPVMQTPGDTHRFIS